MPKGYEREGGQLQFKRQAFRNNIRRQELKDYFANARNNLQRSHQLYQEQEEERVQKIVDALPHSHEDLVQSILQNLDATCKVLLQRIEQISDKMVRLEIVQWASYVRVLNKLLVSIPTKKAEAVVKHTLLAVLECADVLTSQYDNNSYMTAQLVELTLDYLYRCGKFLMEINRLQLSAVIAAVDRVWHSRLDFQQQRTLLRLCVNLLSAQFDPEQSENISPQRQGDLELLKKQFVNCVFYKDLSSLHRLIRLTVDSMAQVDLRDLLVLGLRLLVNITILQDKPSFFYPMLDFNVLHLVQFCIMQGLSLESTFYAVRLLNNLLVNDEALTGTIMRELSPSILLNAYERQRGTFNRDEFITLFVNMLHYLNDDEQQVRRMMGQAHVHILIFDFLEDFDDIDEQLVKSTLNALIIMHEHNSIEMKRIVKERGNVLRKLQSKHEHEVDVETIQEILKIGQGYAEFV